jgi:phosphoglycerate dehydrogenase-like enzyme
VTASRTSLGEPRSLLPRRIVVGAEQHAELVAALREQLPDVEMRGNRHTAVSAEDLAWGDTYVGFRRPPLPTMGNVRWVHCTGAGVDSWLYPTELPPTILLTRTAESFGPMIAEWALARALAFTQRLAEVAALQRARAWKAVDIHFIRGTRAVIVGTGDVGSHIGRAFGAFGARVTGVSRSGRGDPAVFEHVARVDALIEVVRGADWLVLALPLTAETRGVISRDVLAACSRAFLINAGRGAVVDESAVPDALDRGWLCGAALDVFEVEPLPPDSPLWDDPRVMVSAHISGPTTIPGAVEGFLDCFREIERNQWPARMVNRDRQY